MRTQRRAIVLTFINLVALSGTATGLPNGQTGRPAFTVPDFAEARQLIRDGMRRDSVPGLAIAVVRNGSPLWEEGFGWADREGRIAATANTPFGLASVTKTLVATATMALHERRRIDIDRPANDYLRTSLLWSPAWDPREATLRRLLNHTSGLTTYNLYCPAERRGCRLPPPDEIIRRYGVLVRPPGEQFDYSNLGYYVLGEVLARATGRELRDVLRDEVFGPLGMTHSSFGVDPALARQTAIAYSGNQGRLALEIPTAGGPTPQLSAASSGYASVHDLGLFGAFHTKVHRAGRRPILSDAAIDTMQFSVVSDRDTRYGLGWWVDENQFGYRSVVAQGGNDHASAFLRLIPSERLVVAVVANKGVNFLRDVSDAALASLLPRYAQARDSARLRREPERSTSTGQPGSSPTRVDSNFVGTWAGHVRTADGDVSVELSIADTGDVSAMVGSRNMTGRARSHDPSLRVTLPGDLESSDATDLSLQLAFYLTRRDRAVNGTVTTSPPHASGLAGQVSYWVEFTKRP